jgi:hypothetical protein
MSVKNEWPTAKINFAVVNQKSVIFSLSGDFLAYTVFTVFIYKTNQTPQKGWGRGG